MKRTGKTARNIIMVLLVILLPIAVFMKNIMLEGTSEQKITDISDNKDSVTQVKSLDIKGVWINYYEFADLIKDKNQDEYITSVKQVINNIKNIGLNTVFLHVRSHCDAFYKSSIFPWSYYISGMQGEAVEYDPLKIFISLAHETGVAVHAWVNPYRVLSGSTSVDMLSENNPAYKILTDDDTANDQRIIEASGGLYFNPADDENRSLVLNGIKEIIENYDVDGIHFDDYFYPSDDAAIDESYYSEYCTSVEVPMALDEWRRTQVNMLVLSVYSAVKNYDDSLLFGISPQANISNNTDKLYADIYKWCSGNYLDYICPQLYFGFEYPDENFRFENLLNEWIEISGENVPLIIGLGPYKLGKTDAGSEEWVNSVDLIKRQVQLIDSHERLCGFVLYNYSSCISTDEPNATEIKELSDYLKRSGIDE